MYRSINISIAIIILSYLMVAVALVETVHAQAAHETIRPSLVYLKATAKGASGTETGVDKETNATGFLVSEDGLILTVYHLISELGNVVPQTVRIEARISEKNSEARRAMIVEGMRNTDLLLLKIPPGREKYVKAILGSAKSHNDRDTVYTSGFPNSISYRKQENKIEVRDGPGGYLWTTGLRFEHGQSGGPIYNVAGEVIGVVKGEEGTLSYMIPIEFADSLLAQVRFAEIKKALQDLDSLKLTIDWHGKLNRDHDPPKIELRYKKIVPGDPQVDSITLKVKLFALKDGEKKFLRDAFEVQNQLRTGFEGRTGGVFDVSEIWGTIKALKKAYKLERVLGLKVSILSTLTDGTEQIARPIIIDFEED
jgi:S1-C subfamily serine protease